MKIHATCPSCHTVLAVAAENAGKKARCRKCGAIISMPDAASSQPETQQTGTSQRKNGSKAESPRSNQPERPPRQDNATPQRRRKELDVEDVWNQALSSYSSPAIEEEDYEAYGIAPKSSRDRGENNPNSAWNWTYNSHSPPGLKMPLIMAAIGIGSALLFGAIGLAVPTMAFVGTAIGGLIGSALVMWVGIRMLKNAFEDAPLTGFLYLICAPYAIYFLFSRWDINQHPFMINLLGVIVWIASIAIGAAVALTH